VGDRIVIRLTDGERSSPEFYGHWCGLRAVKVMNDVFRRNESNGIHSMMCNFIVEIMGGQCQKYSYYVYSTGEADGSADWDNYTWCLNTAEGLWTSTVPELDGMRLTPDQADEYVRRYNPSLYA
jgi:hypothetical protein